MHQNICLLPSLAPYFFRLVDFTIIAFAIFVAIKAINKLKRKEEAAPAAPAPTPEDIVLLREIRDALKK